jgi:hypothetical protein
MTDAERIAAGLTAFAPLDQLHRAGLVFIVIRGVMLTDLGIEVRRVIMGSKQP